MSREVDERVVAMYFDNKNFEKNAKTTIETLGELKSSMDLTKAAKGFDVLKKASEDLKLDDIARKAKNLQSTFKTLGGTLTNVFKIGTGPLNSLHNLFSTFQSYVTKFIGFDLAGKLVNGIENAMRQLTIAPISAGFNEYELKMDSIKTIMSGTGESLDRVTRKIQELNTYADQTIYSFSDMTSNIGKFTNNKVPLNDATAAIKGISNAAADAGQGAQQASMAMYNLSQAMGVGSLKLIDFKSLENANIATVRLKETFMEAGAAHGQLVKEMTKNKATGEMEVHYYLKDPKTGKKYKDKKTKKFAEVTAENFRETLNKDWANKEVILDTFKIYSGEIKSIDDLKRMGYNEATGFSDEDLQKLVDIGTAAMEAATQVRTFTKMWDALKEAAQSGWSETLEYIFGDMEEGTKLWTRLNEKISGWLGKSSDSRNSAFAQWRGMYQREDGTWAKQHDLWVHEFDENGDFVIAQLAKKQEDGREVLLNSFFELIDVIESLGSAVGTAWTDVFGKFDSNVLWNITNGFRDFVRSLKAWIGTADDSNSRLSKITKGLRGVFTIAKIVVNFFKSQISLLTKALQPFVELAVDAFGKFGEFFDDIDHTNIGTTLSSLGTAFTNLWNKIRNMNWDTVKAKFAEVWTSMKNNVREWMYDNGLGGVWETLSGWKTSVTEWFDGVRASLDTAWGNVTKWFDESGVGGFFRDIWSWIKEKFGIGDNSANKHIPSNIILENGDIQGEPQLSFVDSFIQALGQIKTDLDAAWKEVSDWFETSGISGFFRGIWNDINYLFEPHWEYTDSEMGYKTEAPIVTFFKGIPTAMQTAWDTVTEWSGWNAIGAFFSGIWDDVSIWFEPTVGENGEPGDSPIVAFFKGIPAAMESAWNSVVEWFENSGIGDFFKNLWETISSPFQSKWVYNDFEMGYKEDAPIIAFFKNLKRDLEGIWNSITSWTGWADIGKFFTDTFGWLSNLLSGKASAEGGTGDEANPAKGITDLVNSVKEAASGAEGADDSVGIIQRILTAVSGFFNDIGTFIGTVTKQTGADKAFETVKDVIEIIGELFTILIGFLHKVIVEKDLGANILAAIGIIGTIVTTIYTNKLRSKIAVALSESEGIGEMFMRICAGILMVTAAIALLTSLDSAKMWEAVGAIAVISILIGIVVVAINKLTQTAPSTDKPVTALERIANNAIKWAGVMGTLWVAMKELPAIINAMKGSGVSGEDINQVVLSIIELVGGISLIVVLASKIGGGNFKGMSEAALGVVAGVAIIVTGLIGVFSTIGAATEKIGGAGTTENMIESAKRTGALITAITEAIGAAFVGFATGGKKKIQETYGDLEADNVKRAAEIAEEFTPERLMALVRFVSTMQEIGEKLPTDIGSISTFAQKLPEIGTNLAKFAYNFKTYFNMEGNEFGDFDTVSDATAKIHGMINLMQDVAELIQYVRVKAGFGSGWDSDTERKFKNFGELSKRIVEMIQEGLGDSDSLDLQFNATPIVDSIVIALGYGETAIAEAVHKMVQAGINNSNNPQKVGQYNTEALTKFWNGNLGLPGPGDSSNPFGGTALFDYNSLFGEGGLQGMMQGAIQGLNVEELSGAMSTQLGGLSEQFKGMFTVDDMQTQLANFLPTGEDGEIDTEGILTDFQSKFDTLNRELEASGANTITIRPVFDTTDLESGIEQINAYFRQNPIMVNAGDATPQITFNLDNNGTISEIRLVQQGITDVITQIHNENIASMETMASLARNINGIAEAVSAMKVILDTGVIAGAVDDYLGYTAFVASRTGG